MKDIFLANTKLNNSCLLKNTFQTLTNTHIFFRSFFINNIIIVYHTFYKNKMTHVTHMI